MAPTAHPTGHADGSAPARVRTAPAARVAAALLVIGAAGVILAPGRLAPLLGGPSDPGARSGARPDAAPAATATTDPSDDPRAGATPPGATAGVGSTPAAPTAPDADAADGAGGSTDVRLVELRGGWRTRAGLDTATAVAVLAGAAHLADRDPGGHAPALAVEAVEQPGPDAVVVTLLVAPAPDGGGPAEGPTTRLAVPVLLGPDGVRVAGAPWSLPGPPLAPAPPTGREVTDEDLLAAARDALERAGHDGSELSALEATDGWPFRVRLAEGAEGPWLRWHLDRFVVTGLPLHEAAGTEEGTRLP